MQKRATNVLKPNRCPGMHGICTRLTPGRNSIATAPATATETGFEMQPPNKGTHHVVTFSDYDQSKYLNAALLAKLGAPMAVTIAAVVEEQVRDPKNAQQMTPRIVVKFVELQDECEGLILNKTNNRILRDKFGDDSDGCINKRVILHLVETSMGPGVRIKFPDTKKRLGSNRITTGPQPVSDLAAVAPADPEDSLEDILQDKVPV